ncbi:MAG: ExbD/TolR family protein [Gammaproteobacteria bacterium]
MSDALLAADESFGVARRPCRIGLTALIDVVFILLMFFMLTSTFVRWHALEIAAPAPAEAPLDSPPPMELALGADGTLTSLDGRVSLGHFHHLTRTTLGAAATRRAVVLRPQADARLQTLVAASEAVLRAGAADVALGPLATP